MAHGDPVVKACLDIPKEPVLGTLLAILKNSKLC